MREGRSRELLPEALMLGAWSTLPGPGELSSFSGLIIVLFSSGAQLGSEGGLDA